MFDKGNTNKTRRLNIYYMKKSSEMYTPMVNNETMKGEACLLIKIPGHYRRNELNSLQ